MIKKITLLLTSFILLFLFSGCVQREVLLEDPQARHSQDNTWGNETNVEDNVDISDLDNEGAYQEGNYTDSMTITTDDITETKMQRVPFPVVEYNRLAKTGKGTVKGTIYVQNTYAKDILGSGTRLYLNPVTSYARQWYIESYIGGAKMEKADSRLFNYLRFTAANSEGKFAFYGVPSGNYYLIGTVECGSECGYSTPKSIRIARRVAIQGNQIVQRDLSRMVD